MATTFGYPVHMVRASDGRATDRNRHRPTTAAVIVLAGVGALLVGLSDRATAGTVAVTPASVRTPVTTEHAAFDASLDRLRDALTAAETALTESEGRVLDDGGRTAVSDRIARGESTLRAGLLLAAIVAPGASATMAMDDGAQRAAAAQLRSDVATLAADVAAWETEQARIAAEQEAARQAAEAAARASVRVRTAGTASAAVAAGPHVENIWTVGGQAEIDACRGSVNMTDIAGYLGGGFYATEHWSCGGRAWGGLGTGSLVSFPGFGLYEVSGRIGGLVYGTDASVLPGGYDGYYQTCIGGSSSNMAVWLLTRVG